MTQFFLEQPIRGAKSAPGNDSRGAIRSRTLVTLLSSFPLPFFFFYKFDDSIISNLLLKN
jgi:hypothetical protein